MTSVNTSVTKIHTLSPSVKLIQLYCGHQSFQFIPGQWISVECNINHKSESAAYSISSTPNAKNQIEIAVKNIPEIPISDYLHNKIQSGDTLTISQAQGNVILPENMAGPIVFIAGGTGIAPLICMAKSLISKNHQSDIFFLSSAASVQECIFFQELQQLAQQHEQFHFQLATTRSNDTQAQFHSRINQAILSPLIQDNTSFYLCGPPKMVDKIHFLLTQSGAAEATIFFDKWW